MSALNLRQLVSTVCDDLISEQYTEDQIAKQVTAWQKANPDADATLEATHQLSVTRDFSEELLYRVLARLLEDGYLKTPADDDQPQ